MTLAAWRVRTGDDAFVERVRHAATTAIKAADAGDPEALSRTAAKLRATELARNGSGSPETEGAKRDMLEEVAANLDRMAAPDPAGIGRFLEQVAAACRAAAAARALGEHPAGLTDLVDTIAAMPSEARQVVFAATLPPDGLAAVAAVLPAATLDPILDDLVAAAPAALTPILAALLQSQANAEPAATLDPAAPPGALLARILAQPPCQAYAARFATATDLPSLAAMLLDHPVPAAVSRPAAAISAALTSRVGAGAALETVRAILLLRLIGPDLPPELDAAAEMLLAAAPDPASEATDDALLRYAEHVVAAGQQAEAIAATGEDPDDLVTLRGDALRSVEDLAAAFQSPAPDDPLGTLPARPLTRLGQALLQARATRPGGYDWSAVAALRRDDPDMFLALVEDERMAVMDLVPIPGGLT